MTPKIYSMTTAFHEVLFPLDIALRSAGGPQRRTDVVALGSGREERNARWAHSRRRYDAGYGVKTFAGLSQVLTLYTTPVIYLLLDKLHRALWGARVHHEPGHFLRTAVRALRP